MNKKLICINCGHEIWLPGIHKNQIMEEGECSVYDKKTGACGCTNAEIKNDN